MAHRKICNATRGVQSSRGKLGGFPACADPISPFPICPFLTSPWKWIAGWNPHEPKHDYWNVHVSISPTSRDITDQFHHDLELWPWKYLARWNHHEPKHKYLTCTFLHCICPTNRDGYFIKNDISISPWPWTCSTNTLYPLSYLKITHHSAQRLRRSCAETKFWHDCWSKQLNLINMQMREDEWN
jgi:hypothetical protein